MHLLEINKELEQEAFEKVQSYLGDSELISVDDLEDWKLWIETFVGWSNNRNNVASIVLGVARYRHNQGMKKLRTKKKSEERDAIQFNIDASAIFLQAAKEYLNLV